MTASTSEPRRLTIPVMAAFGFGQLGEALVTIGFTTFLLYFYNQVLGVSGTITGIALAISLFVDAVVDPIAGSLSDRLRSRWGRRHPFILLSAIPLGGCFFLIFNPPAGFGEYELAAWLVVWTLATRIALTFFHVPHLALGAEMAHDYNQRSTMYSYNTFFSIVGQALGVALAYTTVLSDHGAIQSWTVESGRIFPVFRRIWPLCPRCDSRVRARDLARDSASAEHRESARTLLVDERRARDVRRIR